MIKKLENGQRVEATSDIIDSWSYAPARVNEGDTGVVYADITTVRFMPDNGVVHTNLFREGLFDLTGLVEVIEEENPRIEQLKKIMADATDELLKLGG